MATDTQLYILSYLVGYIAVAIFDITAITDDFLMFLLISPIVAPIIGAVTFFAIAIPLGAVLYLSDLIRV
jgi:hypothetical protein